MSLREPAETVRVTDTSERLAKFAQAEADVKEAGNIVELSTQEGDELAVATELAPAETG